MIGLRNLANWAGLPLEVVATLPPPARAWLTDLVNARDPAIVGERGKQ